MPCDISLIHLWIRLVPAGAMASRVALSVLSLLPVVCGARRAARRDQVKQAACAVEEPARGWLAARAPLCSGVALLALHFLYRMCPHDVLSEVLAVYSLVLGTVALLYSIRPTVLVMLPEGFPNTWYQVTLNQGLGTARRAIWSIRFDRRDLLSLAASLSVGLCYFVTKVYAPQPSPARTGQHGEVCPNKVHNRHKVLEKPSSGSGLRGLHKSVQAVAWTLV